ncbi:TPA: hypothetical protein TUM56_001982 [Streptococcus equi subsp. zooepidemicus]|nr:hypothetical protein [Streptococcus equi subsp. zooepidemicus]MCD3374951.1 hypothetical protein [Streptococcus equi subsp. zooepidemicus]MCD3447486.1 hypothetical protein [Streptococcus equi subsp. zooepidemicus]MCD3468439.1 hypothetical protein [Streptococcus equi subsp. zooepidemicus]UFR19248.1 hypothetical protein KV238_04480 [Streptococcus equi subsp. zooepidemicus]
MRIPIASSESFFPQDNLSTHLLMKNWLKILQLSMTARLLHYYKTA